VQQQKGMYLKGQSQKSSLLQEPDKMAKKENNNNIPQALGGDDM